MVVSAFAAPYHVTLEFVARFLGICRHLTPHSTFPPSHPDDTTPAPGIPGSPQRSVEETRAQAKRGQGAAPQNRMTERQIIRGGEAELISTRSPPRISMIFMRFRGVWGSYEGLSGESSRSGPVLGSFARILPAHVPRFETALLRERCDNASFPAWWDDLTGVGDCGNSLPVE